MLKKLNINTAFLDNKQAPTDNNSDRPVFNPEINALNDRLEEYEVRTAALKKDLQEIEEDFLLSGKYSLSAPDNVSYTKMIAEVEHLSLLKNKTLTQRNTLCFESIQSEIDNNPLLSESYTVSAKPAYGIWHIDTKDMTDTLTITLASERNGTFNLAMTPLFDNSFEMGETEYHTATAKQLCNILINRCQIQALDQKQEQPQTLSINPTFVSTMQSSKQMNAHASNKINSSIEIH